MAKKKNKAKQSPISPKQERFCLEYVKDLNGTQAAIRAGYSEKTSAMQASRLLTKENIQRRIQELQQTIANKANITVEWILTRLRKEATRQGNGASHSARVKALELLGKRQKMWIDKAEVTGPDDGPIQVVEVVKPEGRKDG